MEVMGDKNYQNNNQYNRNYEDPAKPIFNKPNGATSSNKDSFDSLIIINNSNNNNNLDDNLFSPEEILAFFDEYEHLSGEELRDRNRIENYFRRDKSDIDKYLKSDAIKNLSELKFKTILKTICYFNCGFL